MEGGEKKGKPKEPGGSLTALSASCMGLRLSHISITCLFWLAALGLVKTLVAGMGIGKDSIVLFELRPSKLVNCEFLQ